MGIVQLCTRTAEWTIGLSHSLHAIIQAVPLTSFIKIDGFIVSKRAMDVVW